MSKHYIGEIGTDIILNCGTDISAATAVYIKYQKPDGTSGSWAGTKYNTNYVKYTLLANDIGVAGRWVFQAYITSTLWTGYGETCEIIFSPLFDTDSLTSLVKLKEYLGITSTNTDDDAFLENIITRVSDDIESTCNRVFRAATYTEYYRGSGTDKLLLRNFPINTITTIHDDMDRDWGADTLIASTEYNISDEVEGMVIYTDGIFTDCGSTENIKIVYNAGYNVLPYDLEMACLKKCAAEYIESKGLFNGLSKGTSPSDLREQADEVIGAYAIIK
jgi:hypothetical protein